MSNSYLLIQTLSYPNKSIVKQDALTFGVSPHLIENMVQGRNQQRTPPLKWGKAISVQPATQRWHMFKFYSQAHLDTPLNDWCVTAHRLNLKEKNKMYSDTEFTNIQSTSTLTKMQASVWSNHVLIVWEKNFPFLAWTHAVDIAMNQDTFLHLWCSSSIKLSLRHLFNFEMDNMDHVCPSLITQTII
jgi:hypothetical protein